MEFPKSKLSSLPSTLKLEHSRRFENQQGSESQGSGDVSEAGTAKAGMTEVKSQLQHVKQSLKPKPRMEIQCL